MRESKLNQPDYISYVVLGDRVIESGWQYPEDAEDQVGNIVSNQPITVRSIHWLRNRNINPNLNSNWLRNA